MLKNIFIDLVKKFEIDDFKIGKLWVEIEKNYSNKKRFYHNLSHLDNLYLELLNVKNEIEDWDTLLFTLFYHDIIYKATSKENEEKSAELAKLRLNEIGFEEVKIKKCFEQILATKLHESSLNKDTNIFTDADLSILGQDWDLYSQYYKNVRKEYSVYPDFLYNPGRKKVLEHFITMPRIFKTDLFFERFEKKAKINLEKELLVL